jgi:DNA-binding LacI/PurR family transcriptional regulator
MRPRPLQREAVLRAASELGYRLNAHAAQLASRRSMYLGVILAEVENPIFTQMLKSTEDLAESQGYAVLLSVSSLDAAGQRSAVNRLLGHRVDGLVLGGTRLPSREVKELAAILPVVTVGRRVAGVEAVSVDDRTGAEVAVQHLVDLGHRRIAHIDGGNGPGPRLRRRGYEEMMTRCGLAVHHDVVRGDYSETGGVAAAEKLLSGSQPPTAVFAANDPMAFGVMGVARRMPSDPRPRSKDQHVPVLAHPERPRAPIPRRWQPALQRTIVVHDADVAELDEDLPGTPQSAWPPVRAGFPEVPRVE